MPFVFKPDRF